MKVGVLANEQQFASLILHTTGIDWIHADEDLFFSGKEADLFINLQENAAEKKYENIYQPVIIHSLCHTLKEMQAPAQVLRINGWEGFISRPVWELCGSLSETVREFMKLINRQFIMVPDEPGLISACVVSMIINEAYFALEEKVSSKEEINTAMKLGTNYPYGPFEWAGIIGIEKIAALLQQLAKSDKRYIPSSLLLKECPVK